MMRIHTALIGCSALAVIAVALAAPADRSDPPNVARFVRLPSTALMGTVSRHTPRDRCRRPNQTWKAGICITVQVIPGPLARLIEPRGKITL